jgi:hypothetical protein
VGDSLAVLIVVEGESAQMVVGEPVVLKGGDVVLAGGLPMTLGN